MLLVCSQKCGGTLFRALFAEVELDSAGAYQDHRMTQPGYICLNCGAPAVDLAEVPGELEAEAREEEAATAVTARTRLVDRRIHAPERAPTGLRPRRLADPGGGCTIVPAGPGRWAACEEATCWTPGAWRSLL